jgi:cobaltochelatase CobS
MSITLADYVKEYVNLEYTREQLDGYEVDELRVLARGMGMSGTVISYMNREGLVIAIMEHGKHDKPPEPEANYTPDAEGDMAEVESGDFNPGGFDAVPADPDDPDPAEPVEDYDELEAEGEFDEPEPVDMGETPVPPASQSSFSFEDLGGGSGCPPPPPPPFNDPLAKVIAQAVEQYLKTSDLDSEMVNGIVDKKIDGIGQKMGALESAMCAVPELVENAVTKAAKKFRPKSTSITIEYKTPDVPPLDLGIQHFQFETVIRAVIAMPPHKRNFFLVGPAGSGKNVIVESIAKAMNLPFDTLPVGLNTSKADLLGFMHAGGGYVGTALRRSYENGGVFLIDEIDAGNPNVLTCINAMTANDHGGFPDALVARHENFVLFAAANTYGLGANQQYVGRLQIDAATRNRFVFLDIPYDLTLEKAISPNEAWVETVQKIRKAVDKLKEKLIVSPRATIYGGHLINAGFNIEEVKNMVIYCGVSPEVRSRIEAQAA